MEKRELILAIMAEIGGWSDDNDIPFSAMAEIELAERIYNMLTDQKLIGFEKGKSLAQGVVELEAAREQGATGHRHPVRNNLYNYG